MILKTATNVGVPGEDEYDDATKDHSYEGKARSGDSDEIEE